MKIAVAPKKTGKVIPGTAALAVGICNDHAVWEENEILPYNGPCLWAGGCWESSGGRRKPAAFGADLMCCTQG